MNRYIEGQNRDQLSLFPLNFDEMIEADNPVRGIDAIVNTMDTDSLGFIHSTTKKTGRPPHNPVKMFKIYLYCYFNKTRSSRMIEKECKRNIELIWLTEGVAPDHKCIAEFRKNNKKAIENGHKAFIQMCASMGLIGKETVAIDGSKFRANNSRKNNVTMNKIGKMISHYEESIHEYLKLLSQNDIEENTSNQKSRWKKSLKKAQERVQELEQLSEQMQEAEISETSLTDPDSHLMGVSNKGTDVAYNVQTAVDNKYHIITTTDVTSSPADQTQLYHMADKTATELGIQGKLTFLADKGYWRAEDLNKCEQDKRMNAIVSPPKEQGNEGFKKSNFKYNEKEDNYLCPMGEILHRTGIKKQTYVNEKACKNCACHDQCTSRARGRVIERNEYQGTLDKAKLRHENNMDLYRKRQTLVEHPFGTIKRGLGFTYFLTRRIENVRTENFLHIMTYNLKRVLNIYSIPDLLCQLAEIRKVNEATVLHFCIYFSRIAQLMEKLVKTNYFPILNN